MNYKMWLIIIYFILSTRSNNKVNINIKIVDKRRNPIDKAEVFLLNGNHKCCKLKSNEDGVITLFGLLKGTYRILVYKDGYCKNDFFLILNYDNNYIVMLTFIKKSIIYGYIKDSKDKPIKDALVVLYKVLGTNDYEAIRFTTTDFLGEYNFINVPKGKYIIKSIK